MKEIQRLGLEPRHDLDLETCHDDRAYPLSVLPWTPLTATAEQIVRVLAQRLQSCRQTVELMTMRTEWVRQDVAQLEFQWTVRPAMAEVYFVHVLARKKSQSYR